MKLAVLKIIFKDQKNFFQEMDQSLNSKNGFHLKDQNAILIDSVQTFNSLLTVNKIQLLRVVSQFAPSSVYQLATIVDREPHHVLKDCRQLESYRFLKLQVSHEGRNPLKPILPKAFDLIITNSPIVPIYAISTKAEQVLLGKKSA